MNAVATTTKQSGRKKLSKNERVITDGIFLNLLRDDRDNGSLDTVIGRCRRCPNHSYASSTRAEMVDIFLCTFTLAINQSNGIETLNQIHAKLEKCKGEPLFCPKYTYDNLRVNLTSKFIELTIRDAEISSSIAEVEAIIDRTKKLKNCMYNEPIKYFDLLASLGSYLCKHFLHAIIQAQATSELEKMRVCLSQQDFDHVINLEQGGLLSMQLKQRYLQVRSAS